MYRVEAISTRIRRELRRIPPADRQRVVAAIRRLAENPRPSGIKQLAPNVYRLRIGSYRVIYRVFDEERLILIGRVARRSERTYLDWEDLLG